MNALWITLALLTSGFAGWPVTALVFRLARTIDARADSRADAAGTATDPAADATVEPVAASAAEPGARQPSSSLPEPGGAAGSERILRGGAIIGALERLAVSLAILAGEPAAIAYVVAIKGLGRFAELKATPAAAERFIIGTLASLLWAAGIAVLAKVFFLG